jgi:hypothetical protein
VEHSIINKTQLYTYKCTEFMLCINFGVHALKNMINIEKFRCAPKTGQSRIIRGPHFRLILCILQYRLIKGFYFLSIYLICLPESLAHASCPSISSIEEGAGNLNENSMRVTDVSESRKCLPKKYCSKTRETNGERRHFIS